jgi:hypothetical protein
MTDKRPIAVKANTLHTYMAVLTEESAQLEALNLDIDADYDYIPVCIALTSIIAWYSAYKDVYTVVYLLGGQTLVVNADANDITEVMQTLYN